MKLLFKNGIKQLLKSKLLFIIYITLTTLSIIFTSVFGIASSYLLETTSLVANDIQNYEYSFKYTSSDYSANDTATLSPWITFDQETVSLSNDNGDKNIKSFPTLTIGGQDGAIKDFDFKYNEDSYLSNLLFFDDQQIINFQFGDLESGVVNNQGGVINDISSLKDLPDKLVNSYNSEDKYNTVMKAEFGSFYRFNTNSSAFKNSLIGQLYEKYDFNNKKYNENTNDAKKTANNIFNYMFYLNNSTITYGIKKILINEFNKVKGNSKEEIEAAINRYINGDGKRNDGFIDGDVSSQQTLGGRIGWINNKTNKYTLGLTTDDFKFSSKSIDGSENTNEVVNYGSYLIKNYESYDIMYNFLGNLEYQYNDENFSNRYLFSTYKNLLNNLTNFDSAEISQVVMWEMGGYKFRFVSAFYTETHEDYIDSIWYNNDLIHIYKQTNSDRTNFQVGSFAASSGYVDSMRWKLGKEYNIIPGNFDKLTLDGVVVDSLNTYPTIYDEDLFSDKEKSAIFYLNNSNYANFFGNSKDNSSKISTDKYQDLSRSYLKYKLKNKANIDWDMKKYRLYLANNITTLGDNVKAITDFVDNQKQGNKSEIAKDLDTNFSSYDIKGRDELSTLNLKSGMLPKSAYTFTYILVVIASLFVVAIIFIVTNILRKLMEIQKTQLGNLKALGYNKRKLIVNFTLFMTAPIIFIVFIGWSISLAIQIPIINIVSTYFNISSDFKVGWKLLVSELAVTIIVIGLLTLLITWNTLKKPVLTLINPSAGIKKVSWISRMSSKIKFKKFTNKMRLTMISTSLKSLISYFFVFLISTFILTMSLIIPGTIQRTEADYYKGVEYKNGFTYSKPLTNVPTSRYSIYESNNNKVDDSNVFNSRKNNLEKSSSLSFYLKNIDDSYTSLLDLGNNTSAWDNNGQFNEQLFEELFYNTLLTLQGQSFSPQVLETIIDNAKKLNLKDTGVETVVNTLASTVIPTLFGQSPIDLQVGDYNKDDYNGQEYFEYCIKQVTNNIVPSTVKELWDKNQDEFKLFSVEFNKINYDKLYDQLVTEFNGYIGNSANSMLDANVYGIDKNSHNQNIKLSNINGYLDNSVQTVKEDEIPVAINKKMELEGLKLGSTINLSHQYNSVYIGDNQNTDTKIANSDWSYDGISDLFNDDFDPSRITYYNGDMYYKNKDNTFLPYNKMQNITLKIKEDPTYDEKLKNINKAYTTIKNKEVKLENGYYVIHPFDPLIYDGDTPRTFGIEALANNNFKETWWNLAISGGEITTDYDSTPLDTPIKVSPILFTKNGIDVDNSVKLKVVGVENIYYGNSIYMSQVNANKILGYNNPESTTDLNGEKINIWSNSKLTKDNGMSDQVRHIVFASANCNNSLMAMTSNNLGEAISTTNYIFLKQEVVAKLVGSIYKICSIFIVISGVASLIVIYLISDMTVGRFKSFMHFMRIQGYTSREINTIILLIFTPIAIAATALGIGLVYLGVKLVVPKALLHLHIAVPLNINILVMMASVLIIVVIFAIAYWYILYSIKKTKLTNKMAE